MENSELMGRGGDQTFAPFICNVFRMMLRRNETGPGAPVATGNERMGSRSNAARRRMVAAGIIGLSVFAAPALAQQINHDDAGPLVIGRDPREAGEIIGKQFLLKVWLTDVGGPGFQSIRAVRLGADGNIALPGIPPIHAEGLSIGALEGQIVALYKPAVPTVKVWVTILDRNPPAPPPPPPPPLAPPKPATKPAPAKAQAATAPATQPAPAKPPATTAPATQHATTSPASPATTRPTTAPGKTP